MDEALRMGRVTLVTPSLPHLYHVHLLAGPALLSLPHLSPVSRVTLRPVDLDSAGKLPYK
jgi:hypothetical protein